MWIMLIPIMIVIGLVIGAIYYNSVALFAVAVIAIGVLLWLGVKTIDGAQ